MRLHHRSPVDRGMSSSIVMIQRSHSPFASFPRRAVAATLLLGLAACSPAPDAAPDASAPAAPLPEEVLSHGQGIYEQLCATCHFDGHGSLTAPALVGSAVVKNSPDKMISQILHGSRGAFVNKDGEQMDGIMPAQDSLSDDDIAAVVTYVRHAYGQTDRLTTPEEAAKLRAQPR